MKTKVTFIPGGVNGHFAQLKHEEECSVDFYLSATPSGRWNVTYGEERKFALSVSTPGEAPAAFLQFAKGLLGKFTVVI